MTLSEDAEDVIERRITKLKEFPAQTQAFLDQFAATWRDLIIEVGLDPQDPNVALASVVTLDLIIETWVGTHADSEQETQELRDGYGNDVINLIPILGWGIVQHYSQLQEVQDVHGTG